MHAPQSEKEASRHLAITSIDFLIITNQLEQVDYHVRFIDLPYRMARSKRFDTNSFIRKLDAPIFAIEMNDIVQGTGALEVAQLIKKHHPDTRTILYGCAAVRFFKELITRPEVDFVMRGNFDGTSAVQLLKSIAAGKFGQVSNLVWKDQRGRVRRNELSVELVSTRINITEYYMCVIRQLLSYRDFDSASLLKRWLRHPAISIYTAEPVSSLPTAFREPEDVYHDIVEMCCFSSAPVSLKGDIRIPGKHYAERLLSLLQHKPVANSLLFELSDAAPDFFIQEIARAAPGFWLNIVPGSHDEILRRNLGYTFSNNDLESTIEAALRARAGRMEVAFMVGLPGQTTASVIHTTAYCEYLLRRFDGDRRLSLSINSCLLPTDFPVFGRPESYGFIPRFHTFDEYLKSFGLPGWNDRLEYQTTEMSAEQIAKTTYDALMRLVRLKAKYGQLPCKTVEDMVANYARGREMVNRLHEIITSGRMDEQASLQAEVDSINAYNAEPRRQVVLPLMLARPQNLLAMWKALVNNRLQQQ